MLTTLQALDRARGTVLDRMGGDWTGHLVISPEAGFYVVRAMRAAPQQTESHAADAAVSVSAESGDVSVHEADDTRMSVPVWASGSAIGALDALDRVVEMQPDLEFHKTGMITVYLIGNTYEVTFPMYLEPGERGDDFSYRAVLDAASGKLIGNVFPS